MSLSELPEHIQKLVKTRDIKRLRDKLSIPSHWTQNTYARDKEGTPVPPRSMKAKCWCLMGAVESLGLPPNRSRGIVLLLKDSLLTEKNCLVVDFNDHQKTSHKDILRVLDRAIEMAECSQ